MFLALLQCSIAFILPYWMTYGASRLIGQVASNIFQDSWTWGSGTEVVNTGLHEWNRSITILD